MTQRTGVTGQAVVLAAGYGERLRPLTRDRAKPSLPLMNRSLILHVLDRLARAGVERAAVNLHHEPASLTGSIVEDPPRGLEVAFSPEERILGTGGGVAAALRKLDPKRPVLVMNGDSLSDLDPALLAHRHAECAGAFGAPATLALRPLIPGDPFTPVHVDGEGAVCGIGKTGRPGRPHVFLGAHVIEAALLEGRPAAEAWDLVRDLYMPRLAGGGRLGAFIHHGWWVEIGSPRLYLEAHMRLLGEEAFMASLPDTAGRPVPAGGSFAAPGVGGLESAEVAGSVLGPGARLEAGCRITGSLLGRDARVGAGARVTGCIVWDGAEVAPGAEASGSLIHAIGGAPAAEPLR